MRAFRELFGGLFLAILAAATVIGGLWLAVTETGQTNASATQLAQVTQASTPTAFIPSSTPQQPIPSQTPVATQAVPTDTSTSTVAPSLTNTLAAPTPTDTQPAVPSPTATETATQTSTATASLVPSSTPSQATSTPTLCAPPISWVQYVVVPGDTLFQLSLRYGVSQQQLQSANCLLSPEIKYGQVLFVPFVASPTPQEPTATDTAIPSPTPIPDPLQINGVTLVSVQADSSRPNGAIATIFVNISGGSAPYTIYNDNAPQAGNPFPVLTECGGALLHTLRVLSGDGQSVDYPYYYSPINCP